MDFKDGLVDYESFGARGDGVADDMQAICAAHEYANMHGLSVRTKPEATYHLGARALTAVICTDTNWNTSRFTIDETQVEDHGKPLFTVRSQLEPEELRIDRLVRDQKQVDARPAHDCYVLVENDQKRLYIRRGLNQNNGVPQHDCFVLRRDGSRDAMLRLNLMGQFTYTQEVFLNLAFRGMPIREVPVEVEYFPHRKSRVAGSIARYALNTFKIIFRTYRDYFPLKFFTGIGAGFLVPGLLLLSFLFGWYLYAGRFTPHIWSGFVVGGFILAAAFCFILGLLADMMVRLRHNQEEILYLMRRD